jgi:GNAT superfamily N-acetyltransferase
MTPDVVRGFFGTVGELLELYMPWFPDSEVVSRPDFLRIKSSVSSPLVNGVLRSGMPDDELRLEARRTKEYFNRLDLPGAWMVVPDDRGSTIGEILVEEGYTPTMSSPGMVVHGVGARVATPHPELDVRRVRTREECAPMRELLTVFGLPDDLLACMAQMTPEGPESLWNYIGFAHAEPVCCGSLFFGVVCPAIFNVATAPAHRCRGFGAAITNHMVTAAGEAGWDEVFLTASKKGYGVYKELGFEDIGTAQYYSCVES